MLCSKNNNAVTTQRKRNILQDICDRVNALGVAHRTVAQIKTKWSNILSDGKEKKGQMNNNQNKTGGGPACTPPNHQQEKLTSLFSKTLIIFGYTRGAGV